jgi:hypothetical protein
MMNAKSAVFLAILLCLLTELCSGQNVLFYKESSNYGREGEQGEIFRREFETRMFHYANWRQRLFVALYDPGVDQTLEVYSKSDGSHWLSYTCSTPAVSRVLDAGPLGYNTKKGLRTVRITRHEIALPTNVASEIQLLWQSMLPGSQSEPRNRPGRVYLDYPAFVASMRNDGSVQTGRLAAAAIDTPAYHSFVQIVEDLLKACDGGQTDKILSRLPSKIQHLRALLKKSQN